MTSWSLRPLPSPASLHVGDALLLSYVEATNEPIVETWGTTDFCCTPRQVLAGLRHQEYVRKDRILAVSTDDVVLGYADVNLPLQDNTHLAELEIAVRPAYRRQGIGSALHDAAVDLARSAGRTTVMTDTNYRAEPTGEVLAPDSGPGGVDPDDPSTRFAVARGWNLEQAYRHSRLDLPLDPDALAAHRADAEAHAGPDYRLVQWTGPCPERWVEQFAVLSTRMSTDAPMGGLDLEEDVWDADRVRAADAAHVERGWTLLVMAAEHVPTGTLAAYTFFVVPEHTDEWVSQEDTLVIKEHRGRRLGMLVKAANLQRLAAEHPTVERVSTWNAEENDFMLAINVALGFRPAGGDGTWQRRL
ncbi:GNAT family N-acetyltransferase [Cellulomonas rhizosphaerae]|uniref:GNAT family N-acetyltransferase n=1 Tax=Cellulomonas rhizosphaerae TaxID=2293719 RepID=A0A413RQV8_9CELL|nr:GNAT family N-acetyltransferase [Cellulomonas rhizosphaerae]